MSLMHAVAAGVCVAAAGGMLLLARGTQLRAAHAVMLAAMVVSAFAMHAPVLLVGCALALILSGALLARGGHEGWRACAVDLFGCAGLMGLRAVPALLASGDHGDHGHAPVPDEAGAHAAVHAAIPGDADHQLGLLLVACVVVLTWAMLRRGITAPDRSPRAFLDAAAGWLMMLGMGAMVIA